MLSAGEEDQNAYDINKLRKPLQDTFMCVPSSPTNIQISDTETREGRFNNVSIMYTYASVYGLVSILVSVVYPAMLSELLDIPAPVSSTQQCSLVFE